MKLLLLSLVCAALTSAEVGQLDWSPYNGRFFLFLKTRLSWPEAQEHCVKLGGSLATIHNNGEEEVVKKLAKGKKAWIGLSDAQMEGKWLWINSYNVDYKNWCKGEPNNLGGNQHCVVVNYTGKKCWDDMRCKKTLPFVCVRK